MIFFVGESRSTPLPNKKNHSRLSNAKMRIAAVQKIPKHLYLVLDIAKNLAKSDEPELNPFEISDTFRFVVESILRLS
jgi:hypothetical protein